MHVMKKTRLISVVIILIVAAWVLLGYKLFNLKEKEDFYGFYVGKEIKDHTLVSQSGDTVSFSDFKGDLLLVNFGYTHCPDICPTTLAGLRKVYEGMEEKKDRIDVLFITIDPERDTVKRLNDFIPYFHNDFTGLTGTEEQINSISSDFGVHYFREDVKSENDYLMSHNSSVFLVDKDGMLLLKYPQQMFIKTDKVVKDIKKIM